MAAVFVGIFGVVGAFAGGAVCLCADWGRATALTMC